MKRPATNSSVSSGGYSLPLINWSTSQHPKNEERLAGQSRNLQRILCAARQIVVHWGLALVPAGRLRLCDPQWLARQRTSLAEQNDGLVPPRPSPFGWFHGLGSGRRPARTDRANRQKSLPDSLSSARPVLAIPRGLASG